MGHYVNEIILALSIVVAAIAVVVPVRTRVRTGKWRPKQLLISLGIFIVSALAPYLAMVLGVMPLSAPFAVAVAVGGAGILGLTGLEALGRSPRRMDRGQQDR